MTDSLPTDSLGIVLTAHGALKYVDVVEKQQNMAFVLPDSAIADGVNRISILGDNGQILSDRLFFQYPRNLKDSIEVKVKEPVLMPSQNINLSFHTLPSSIFSVSVRDAGTEKNVSSLDCENWLLLAGELHGYVAHPEYYFESDDEEHREAADLLMMVQGWRRYDIEQMMGKKNFKVSYPIEKGLSIAGKLNGANKKSIVAHQKICLRLYNDLGQSLKGNVITDSLGYYAMEVPPCDGEWTMLMTIPNNYKVGLNRNLSPIPRHISDMELGCPQDMKRFFSFDKSSNDSTNTDENFAKGNMLPRTYMLPTVVKKMHFWESSIAWDNQQEGKITSYLYYNIDKEIDKILDAGESTPCIYAWLKEKNTAFQGEYDELLAETMDGPCSYLRYTRVRKKADEADAVTENMGVCDFSYKNRLTLWVLDNSPKCLTNCDFLLPEGTFLRQRSMYPMPVTMEEVKSIFVSDDSKAWKSYLPEIFQVQRELPNGNYITESIALRDVTTVFVYTHKMFTKSPKNLRRTYFDGYSPVVEFYSPEYGELPANEDFRRTLYWNPYMKTDKDGNVDLKICNTARCKQLIVSAEAITPQGRIIKNK